MVVISKVEEKSLTSRINTKAIVKDITIGIVVGLSYFAMLVGNPLGYLTGIASLQTIANLRWANALKFSALFSPSAIIGMATGSYMFNVYTGKIALGAYAVSPLLHAGAAFIIYFAAKTFGRSFTKDVVYMASLGIMAGVISSANLALIALFTTPEGFTHLISILLTWKIAGHVLVYVSGYLMATGVYKIYKSFKH